MIYNNNKCTMIITWLILAKTIINYMINHLINDKNKPCG